MKLVIRNTSRDKMTAAKRKARPGDVQSYPTIQKVRLPPGGSLTADSSELSVSEVQLLVTLSNCGCLRVFSRPSHGPMKELSEESLLALSASGAPEQAPAPLPRPVTVVEPQEPAVVEEAPSPEPEEVPEEEPTQEEPAYLEGELKAMKNAQLRDILLDMGCGRTTGMNKSALVAKILETQEA